MHHEITSSCEILSQLTCGNQGNKLTTIVFLLIFLVQFHQVPTYDALHEYIEKAQLTPEFAGTLSYSHHDWVKFRMVCVCLCFTKSKPEVHVCIQSNIPLTCMNCTSAVVVSPLWIGKHYKSCILDQFYQFRE